MLDDESLYADLLGIGLGSWRETLAATLRERITDGAHGRLHEWRAVIEALPNADDPEQEPARIRELLLKLAPWRKGPFRICGVEIDAEWRSDLKWNRLKDGISPLQGRSVLDVGCGNGYYALRMLDAGANCVIGVDPALLFVMQFLAIRKLTGVRAAHVLPLRLEDLPAETHAFDTTFSMGVLYHRRDPIAHLRALRETVRPGGEVVLETLIIPGEDVTTLEPADRYARMRNVWHLPTIAVLREWLERAGFADLRVIDVAATTTDEQRTTEWMPYESLAEALDPGDSSRTIEGLPAPTRAILVCRVP